MRIISWNCCWQKEGFTEEKRNEILKLNPDILIVQECKQDDWEKLNYSSEKGHWYSDGKEAQGDPNKSLGIGMFCNNDYFVDCSLFHGKNLSNMRYAIPYIIKKNNEEILTLFSVWAKSGYDNYHVPIFNSLQHFYIKINSPIVLAGDFNTGSQYGNEENCKFYENIKKELKEKYHLENCAFWQEWLPTFHKEERENYDFYLDDHCFFELPHYVVSFGMGNWFHWSKYSDHMPIIIDLNGNLFNLPKACQLTHSLINSNTWKKFVKEFKEESHYIIPTLKYGEYKKELW